MPVGGITMNNEILMLMAVIAMTGLCVALVVT
jgi:hypothetical protein